jgi:hypothetical protein
VPQLIARCQVSSCHHQILIQPVQVRQSLHETDQTSWLEVQDLLLLLQLLALQAHLCGASSASVGLLCLLQLQLQELLGPAGKLSQHDVIPVSSFCKCPGQHRHLQQTNSSTQCLQINRQTAVHNAYRSTQN